MSRPTSFRLTVCNLMQHGNKPIFFSARHALKRYRKAKTRIIKNRVTTALRKMRLGKLPSCRQKAHLVNEVSLKESYQSEATQSPFFLLLVWMGDSDWWKLWMINNTAGSLGAEGTKWRVSRSPPFGYLSFAISRHDGCENFTGWRSAPSLLNTPLISR